LSVQIKDLERDLAFIPKERPIVTVSNHAGRAGQAGDLLTKKGFNVIGAVGSQLYEAEGGTIVKIAIPPKRQAAAAAPAEPKP
jgi:rhodanese-related sulfurtransferase